MIACLIASQGLEVLKVRHLFIWDDQVHKVAWHIHNLMIFDQEHVSNRRLVRLLDHLTHYDSFESPSVIGKE